jgi:hypothetical protein
MRGNPSEAGKSAMFVVNIIKGLKRNGVNHQRAHLIALWALRSRRLADGKNTDYVDSRIRVMEKFVKKLGSE